MLFVCQESAPNHTEKRCTHHLVVKRNECKIYLKNKIEGDETSGKDTKKEKKKRKENKKKQICYC